MRKQSGNHLPEVSAHLLNERRVIWESKEIIKKLYHKWYQSIFNALRSGTILELGGGSGNLKETFPEAISSDIVFVPWLDAVMDAHALPFKTESLDNIVLFDVLHHLKAPKFFFYEAERVLRPKGRIIMIEPYVSWASFFIYRFFHAEGMKWHVDPFVFEPADGFKDPFLGNQAVPTLLFEKYSKRFCQTFTHLKIIKQLKTDFLIYPLSGGFHNPSLCPAGIYDWLEDVERLLYPLRSFLAFRIFVVIEKKT